jgi:hypothetical protein
MQIKQTLARLLLILFRPQPLKGRFILMQFFLFLLR